MKRYNKNKPTTRQFRYFNIDQYGELVLMATATKEIPKKTLNRIFKKKGYECKQQN